MPAISRRRFLAGAGAAVGAAAGLEGWVLEPRRLAVTRHRIGVAAEPSQTPLRLTVMTDLHLRSIGGLEESVAAAVAAFAPDVVVIVGDAIDRADSLRVLDDFLGMLPRETPKFATLGNWEHWSGVGLATLADTYAAHSGRLLVNESALISFGGRQATLVGLDDLVGGTPDLGRATSGTPPSSNALLLSHCPAYRDTLSEAAASGFAAMLSGHTHGGQVALGPWAPLRPRGSGRYVSGWYRGDGVDLYVSRGLGTSIVPVRLGSVPELAHFDWLLGEPHG